MLRNQDTILTGTRFDVLIPVAGVYVTVSAIVRTALLLYEGNDSLFAAGPLLQIYGTGLIYDLAALAWILIPFTLNAVLWSNGVWGRRGHFACAMAMGVCGVVALGFGSVAELLFWNEFSARFNFIAVDYLVYTREVAGNIQESYPLGRLSLLTAAVVLPVAAGLAVAIWRMRRRPAPTWPVRVLAMPLHALVLVVIFFGLSEAPHSAMNSAAARELAGNGAYALFRAFRNNDLDYDKYYRILPDTNVSIVLQDELAEAGLVPDTDDQINPFSHKVSRAGPPLRKNVVLVTIESLGADYVTAFGGVEGLTPRLSALADESLVFDKLYATGLRTVRGLEAVTLSVPPTPGRAVPVRQRNRGLDSLGSILKDNGYSTMFLYGGYSYFDNMRDFFSGAGYEVYDRTGIESDDIHHETIWGVADEDLFDFALKKLDAATGKKPFFAHIMTTSNHRPYTYPANRIDIPSHTGRDGAVKYTDWAIGRFLDQAREKSWFNDTIFVFLADHTSHGRGRVDLPPENYRIPMWIFSPGFVKPGRVSAVASQIDVAPTLLGLLNVSYESHFFGQDILSVRNHHERAFLANYLSVGYMEDGLVAELGPQRRARVLRADTGKLVSADSPKAKLLIEEAVSFYQSAAREITKLTHE